MSSSPDSIRSGITPRSRYRIKVLALSGIFLACWLVLRFQFTTHDILALAIAGAAAVLLYFVRCERCHSSLYYRAGGARRFFPGPSFLWAKRCPSCNLERL
jgi:hypothetical protein